MNLSIVLSDFLATDGTLKTYRFIPTNEYNKVVVDRLSDIHLDVKGNTEKDVGLLRIYNSDKCQLITTNCKIKNFSHGKYDICFQFEHMYVPVEISTSGSCGIYNLILPFKHKLTELHIVDPFNKEAKPLESHKHFKYQLYRDNEKQLQIIQMELRSRRGSFSFIVKGKMALSEKNTSFLEYIQSEIYLDEQISSPPFDEGVEKIFRKRFYEALICKPTMFGIGIDFKNFFKNQ